ATASSAAFPRSRRQFELLPRLFACHSVPRLFPRRAIDQARMPDVQVCATREFKKSIDYAVRNRHRKPRIKVDAFDPLQRAVHLVRPSLVLRGLYDDPILVLVNESDPLEEWQPF